MLNHCVHTYISSQWYQCTPAHARTRASQDDHSSIQMGKLAASNQILQRYRQQLARTNGTVTCLQQKKGWDDGIPSLLVYQ